MSAILHDSVSPPDLQLKQELAVLQRHADLKAAIGAATVLTADELRALRDWIDARLGAPPDHPPAHSTGPEAGAGAQPDLSDREAEVLRLIALGYSNKEIAARLEVSVKTVETYKTRAMEKLQLRGRVDIVRYAIRCGWLDDVPEPQLAPAATTSAEE